MKYEYPIVPASSGPIWLLAVMTVFMVGMVSLFAYLAWSSRNTTFEISGEGLRIRGDMYGRMLPAELLRPAEARILDLNRDKDYVPRRRTNGAGLPGYSAGWFTLRSGEKALVFVTNKSRVVYLPTTAGYSVLMSPQDPERMLTALQETAPLAKQ